MYGSVPFKMLGLIFFSKLTASKKIGPLIRSIKFLSPKGILYLYKSTIHPCMEYCCHVWAGAPSYYLLLLDKLQKRIWRTVRPSLAASLEPLAHRWNVASLSLLYRYYFGRCSSELAHFIFLVGDLLIILIDCMIFLSPFLDVSVYVNSFFPCTATLWNYLSIEWFPLTCNLNGFKSRINRYLLTVGSLQRDFLCALIIFCFFFL